MKTKIIKTPCSCTYGWVVDWINSHLAELPKGAKFVELGTFVGGTTRLIALANPHIEIHTINLHNLYEDNSYIIEHLESMYNLTNVNNDTLHYIQRMHLEDFSNVFTYTGHSTTIPVTGFHASFVDAHHGYDEVMADLDFVWENTVDGGIIFGDDIDSPGIYNAVVHWAHKKGIEFTIFSKAFKIVKTVPKYVFSSQQQRSFTYTEQYDNI
jgi:predicted O-methyltransferase YrrM